MNNEMYAVGTRVEKFCAVCNEERGHIVASLTKLGRISRVTCPKCETRGTFRRSNLEIKRRSSMKPVSPYDQTRTYHAGQIVMHSTYGEGEITAVIEPQKIDVLFSDRVRRLVHSRSTILT